MATLPSSGLNQKALASGKRGGLLDQYFYFLMSLLIAAVVVYGFSFTVQKNLFHANPPRPFLLYVHAAVYTAWLGFFILQSALVRTRNVVLHRRLGWFGVAMGAAMLVLGVATALVMGRFNAHVLQRPGTEWVLIIPLLDMLCFGTTFGLAVLWRKKPEYHRRLMLIATCALTAASFGRFVPDAYFYMGVDSLILLGVLRDLFVNGRIHIVYRIALPLFMIGQSIAVYTALHELPYWQKIGTALLR